MANPPVDEQFGIWGVFCEVVDYGKFEPVAVVKGWRPDLESTRGTGQWFNEYLDAAAQRWTDEDDSYRKFDSWDDLPDRAVDDMLEPEVWSVRAVDSLFRTPDGGPVLFVNVYRLDQGYGGPEEGGWYYETGEPVCSYVVSDGFEAAMNLRQSLSNSEFPDKGYRYSVRPQGIDYGVWVELDPPADPWPARKPHYE